MSTTIFYYTGTGNALWTARTISHALGGADVVSISENRTAQTSRTPSTIGLVFPVHIWGVPRAMVRFVSTLTAHPQSTFFAIAVNAGQVANTLVQLEHLLRKRDLMLSLGFEIRMPSNYIPWGGPGPRERQEELFRQAENKISRIASHVMQKNHLPVERGPLWQRMVFSALYRLTYSRVSSMDSSFWVDQRCNQCGICGRICPAGNIRLPEGEPVWQHGCEQCFACLQWCPQEAIQYGKKTPGYERYHHPAVTVKDLLGGKASSTEWT
ncbi:MAG: EFR1 family ferrodoxin [Desulfomonilia bacterium]|nr:EFR1 family ferrodoxin [Desulfomonilia bacterium]